MYLQTGVINEVKIYPDTVLTGLTKIGGIVGLMGLVVAIARILNEKRLQDKLDDKIAELKKQGLSFNAKKATCCSKCYRYFFKTKDRAETH
jgi:hypothetical protein